MKDFIEMVKGMNNRDIDNTSAQLSLFPAFDSTHTFSYLSSFDYIYSTVNLHKAWYLFSKGKHGRADVIEYEHRFEQNLFDLQERLATNDYRHGTYVPFTVWDPKQRRIHKASVRDRIVHQLIVSAIEPLFEPQFIFDSFSCRKNKGTHAAVTRLRTFLRRVSKNNTQTVYALKCDIKQFFASVDQQVLRELLIGRVKDARLVKCIDEVIGSYEVTKSKGIPLGNLTSQLFANVYMHQFDWFVKHKLKEKHYICYCDDFIILSTNRSYLESLIEPITQFLREELCLTVHPNKTELRSWNQGIDFLGYVLKPNATVLRHKTKKRAINRTTPENISSYLGLCGHADEYELSNLLKTIAWGMEASQLVQ